MVTLTATPEPGHSPPRVRLDVATGNSSTLQSVEIKRAGKTIRQPPFAGQTTAVAYDYEMPYGRPATYEVTGTTVGAYTTEWSESWANLSAWSGDVGLWSVSGGEARTTEHDRSITRTASQDIGKVSLGGTPEWLAVDLLSATGATVATVEYLTGYASVRLTVGAQSAPVGLAGGPTSVSVSGSRVTVQGTAGWRLSLPSTTPVRRVRLRSLVFNQGGTAKIGAVAVAPSPTSAGFTATAATQVNPKASWLIHPTYTSLSVPFEGDCAINMGAETRAQVTSGAQRTIIPIQGSSTPVVVVNGRRGADAWTLALNCPSIGDRDAVRALVDDQSPLLLRAHSPACDIPDGWYSIGDVGSSRPAPIAANEMHRISLPMQPVREPVVAFGNAGWSYSDVRLVGTYADVQARFPTYLDLALGGGS